MEDNRFALPNQKNYEYANELAYQLAGEQLAGIEDIERQCHKCGARYQVLGSQKIISLPYLNRLYVITLPAIEISAASSPEEVPIREKVLILHYFIRAQGTPPANRLITFRELPEGKVYYPTFLKRTAQPLVNHFGKEPHLLADVAAELGGQSAEYGDAAVTFAAFPCVPVTMVLWQGDEEFAPEGSVLFDAGIADYLATEDVTVLCETITWRLIGSLKG